MLNQKLILASTSPRRKEILANLGMDFEIQQPVCDERLTSLDFEYKKTENIALQKALSVNDNKNIIVGADTVVVFNNKILTKPKDEDDALNMLTLLSGKTHYVVTSVAIIYKDFQKTASDTTYVTFNDIEQKDLIEYIKNFKPFDKAGAYGIQELPKVFGCTYDGEFDNVVGFPTKLLLSMLKEISSCKNM